MADIGSRFFPEEAEMSQQKPECRQAHKPEPPLHPTAPPYLRKRWTARSVSSVHTGQHGQVCDQEHIDEAGYQGAVDDVGYDPRDDSGGLNHFFLVFFNFYPTPHTVVMILSWRSSSFILPRSRRICTITVLLASYTFSFQTFSKISSVLNTLPRIGSQEIQDVKFDRGSA